MKGKGEVMGNYDFSLDLQDKNNTQYLINEQIRDNSVVMEFGPANGRLTRHLSENRHCNVTIVEIDEESGKSAKQFAEESFLGPEEGDIEKFLWTKVDKKFDFIIFADVLEHLHCPDKVLMKCIPLLKEDGRILVSVPNIVHNSILVDMLKDRFNYTKTGLLDNTHVHFFTYESFLQMVKACGLYVENVQPVYSRVGNNEIDNHWEDIPAEVENVLRKRVQGSIYQFVYSVTKKDYNEGKSLPELAPLEIEMNAELDARLYYKATDDAEYEDNKCKVFHYRDGEIYTLEQPLEEIEGPVQVRLNPLADSAVVLLADCEVVSGEERKKLKLISANSEKHYGNIFLFFSKDPWMEFETIPDEFRGGTLQITFRPFLRRLGSEDVENLESLTASFEGFLEGKTIEDLLVYASELEKAKGYMKNLENSLEGFESSRKEQDGYIQHLEKDIGDLKDAIESRNRDIQEKDNRIRELEAELEKRRNHRIKYLFKKG